MAKRRNAYTGPVRAIGYVRVSTGDQAENGHGMDAQEADLRVEADKRGWDLRIVRDEGLSGKDMKRPALSAALESLDNGEADLLVATKLDRVSRSVLDFMGLLDRAQRCGWSVLILDMPDTDSPNGELFAVIRAAFAQYERRLASIRTKEGLAAARAKGKRLGRPSVLPIEVVARIVNERRNGKTQQAIADGLMADGIATARGGDIWRPSSIGRVLESQAAMTIQ